MSDCEPLRGKERVFNVGVINTRVKGFLTDDISSVVRFYKRYKDHPLRFEQDYPKEYKKWKVYITDSMVEYPLWLFDNWLFDYCFGDVME